MLKLSVFHRFKLRLSRFIKIKIHICKTKLKDKFPNLSQNSVYI